MDETLWCPVDPSSDVSSLRRATQSATGKLWDSAYDKVLIPALKIGDSADINDSITVGENSCVSNLYKVGKRATVKVYGDLEGSGFFVSSDGMIATAAHIVPGPDNTVLVDDSHGNRFAARVKIEDQINDIAILKIVENREKPTPFNALKLRDEPLRPQEPVAAFGHPKSWDNVYMSPGANNGELTSYERASTKDWQHANQLAAIRNHVELGNSGGPLLDTAGRAVGVVVGRYTSLSDMSLVITVPALKSALAAAHIKIGFEEGGWSTSQNRTNMTQNDLQQPSAVDSTQNFYAKRSPTGSGSAAGNLSTALSTWGNNAKSLINLGVAVTTAPLFNLPIRVKPLL